jgi:hypothetical protein
VVVVVVQARLAQPQEAAPQVLVAQVQHQVSRVHRSLAQVAVVAVTQTPVVLAVRVVAVQVVVMALILFLVQQTLAVVAAVDTSQEFQQQELTVVQVL